MSDRLRSDLTVSLKARDELRSSTLRMMLSALSYAEVAGKERHQLGDDEVIAVLSTEAKKRREAAAAYADGNRPELAAKEVAEGEIIAEYLPAQLTDEEVRALVAGTIAELGVADEGQRAMGRVMGALTPRTRGRADGAAVAAEVRRQLG